MYIDRARRWAWENRAGENTTRATLSTTTCHIKWHGRRAVGAQDRAESCRSVRGSYASSDGSLYGGGGGMAAATDVFLYALYFGNARTRERSAAPPASQPASQHRRPILIFSMQCRYPSLYMCSVRRGGEANGNPGVDYMHHARQPPECMPARTSTQDLCSSIGGVYLGF